MYKHLQGVALLDTENKQEYPIQVILGASEYSSIKMGVAPRVGRIGEPMAELTWLGLVIMPPGCGVESSMYLTHTSHSGYERLCPLVVLGLEDCPDGDHEVVYKEFKEQLQRDSAGWCKTSLIWKAGHPPLQKNKVSLTRFFRLLRKPGKHSGLLSSYEPVIQDQTEQGIVELVHSENDAS